MKEAKLFNLLRNISHKEFNEMGDFISSPVMNKKKDFILLYKFLKKNYIETVNGLVTKEMIFKNVYIREKFNESKYWKLISGLSTIIDKYLIFSKFEKDIYYQKNLLLESYRSRNIHKQFDTLSKEIQKKFAKEFNKGLNFYLNRTHYYFQKISYLGSADALVLEDDLKGLFENLKMFFVMTNVTSISIISNFKKDFLDTAEKDIWLFQEVFNYLEINKKKISKEYLTIYIFFLIIKCKLDFNNENYYNEIKNILIKNNYKFSQNLLRHILINNLDYTVKKVISGEGRFLKEVFFINKLMDENNLTLFGEYIHGDYFYSAVEHSIMLEELGWAKEFAEKYKIYLRNEQRKSAENLAMSRIHFESGDYELSLTKLLKVENINPYFYLSYKLLLLQNYFERKEFYLIDPVIETLSKYLKRRIDISNELKDNYLKFILYFKKLKVTATTRKYLAKILYKEISSEKFFIYNNWMLRKVKEIS
ncbi:MAG: hypothetical protein ABI462_10315 [Ignavibacteria bacterium]